MRPLLMYSIVLVPLAALAARFEPYEPQRVGLLALLVTFALFHVGLRPLRAAWLRDPATRPLLLAAGLWCAALALSSLLALSPAEALLGDAVRRMGLWTHLALAAGLLFGARLNAAWAGRLFWGAGVVVAAHVLLQAGGVFGAPDPRPAGLLGSSTLTAGWLAGAVLWAGFAPKRSLSILYIAGLFLMLAALVFLGTRGAAAGLAAGALAGGAAWYMHRRFVGRASSMPSTKRTRYSMSLQLQIVVIALVITIVGASFAVIPAARDAVASLPLVSRFLPEGGDDATRTFRELLWGDALQIAAAWPRMSSIEGLADPFAALRPLVGYGLENFDTPHAQVMDRDLLVYAREGRVDRAHNDTLDTLVMTGWLGLAARFALWGSAAWLAARCLRAGRRDAALALAVITAHVVEIQFSFVTLANAWPAWLAMGVLLRPEVGAGVGAGFTPTPPVTGGRPQGRPYRYHRRNGVYVGAQHTAPLRPRWLRSLALPLLMLVYLARNLVPVGMPEGVAAGEIALLVAGVWALGGAELRLSRLPPRRALAGALAALLLVMWGRDIAADVLVRQSFLPALPPFAAQTATRAAALRPWDTTLAASAGTFALAAGDLSSAEAHLQRAARLNLYSGDTALRLATVYRLWANTGVDMCANRARAARYYAAAARLWPLERAVWGAWLGFQLEGLREPCGES